MTFPVTLYLMITVSGNVPPLIIPNNPLKIPTKGDDAPVEEATKPPVVLHSGPSQSAAHVPLLPSPDTHALPIKANTPIPDGQEKMLPTEKARNALHHADEAKKLIDQVKTWKGTVSGIKWVMDTVGPITEVCPISVLSLLDSSNFRSISKMDPTCRY